MFNKFLSIGLISNYGFIVFAFLGLLIGSFFFWKKARDEHFDEITIFDITLNSLIWGFVGARILYIILHFNDFGLNIWYWFSVWNHPGFYWLGFYLGAWLNFARRVHREKWNAFKILDLAVIGVALGQVFFYIGMFLSSSGFGKVTNLPLAIKVPGSFQPRLPLSLFAAILWSGIFVLLIWLEGKYRRFIWYQKFKGDSLPGFVFFIFIILLGLIGIFWSLLIEAPVIILGINLDTALYTCLVLLGLVSLLARSGVGKKLGLDNIWWLGKN